MMLPKDILTQIKITMKECGTLKNMPAFLERVTKKKKLFLDEIIKRKRQGNSDMMLLHGRKNTGDQQESFLQWQQWVSAMTGQGGRQLRHLLLVSSFWYAFMTWKEKLLPFLISSDEKNNASSFMQNLFTKPASAFQLTEYDLASHYLLL
jgi:hypothetical protein